MDFQINKVVNRTFGSISRNFMSFFLLSLMLVGVPMFVIGFAQFMAANAGESIVGLGIIIALVASFAATYILLGALIYGANADFNGKHASLRDCLSTGLKHFLPLLGIAILMTLGIVAGTLLLVVPGIILTIMWVLAIPVRVVESKGIVESFGRSRELTKDNRWKIFGLFVIYVVLATVISSLTSFPVAILFTGGSGAITLLLLTLQAMLMVLLSIVSAVGVSALYYELRKSKDGTD